MGAIAGLSLLTGVLANNFGGLPGLGGSGDEEIVNQADQTAEPSRSPVAATTPTKPGSTDVVTDTSKLNTKPGAVIVLNPAVAAPGSSVSVAGTGFDPRAQVDFYLKRDAKDKGTNVGYIAADKGGGLGGFSFTIPESFAGGTFLVEARQHDDKQMASAQGSVRGLTPTVKLGEDTGKVGDTISVSGKGFAARETVKVYFNSLTGEPVATLQSDGGGGLNKASVKVPFGAAGDNTFLFVGDKSQAPVAATFFLLNLYPVGEPSVYSTKADNDVSFNGTDFGPNENVRVYLNSTAGLPIAVVQAGADGSFERAGKFHIPFELTGKNTLIFVGEQSQTATTASIDILPYTPSANPSTYGGGPGTTITFYGTDFGRNEVVRVFVGATKQGGGKEIACFKTDDKGSGYGGNYTIPSSAQIGSLGFRLVGDKSRGTADASVTVQASEVPVQIPDQSQNYKCPFDGEPQQPQSSAPASPQNSPSGQASPQASPSPSSASPKPSPSASNTPAKPSPSR